jgi:ferrous iron transport protein A
MSRSAAELAMGETGQVAQVSGDDEIARRILEMGVTPGAKIRRVGTAPLGDPIEIELRGYRLSLRKSEAEHVELASTSPS